MFDEFTLGVMTLEDELAFTISALRARLLPPSELLLP